MTPELSQQIKVKLRELIVEFDGVILKERGLLSGNLGPMLFLLYVQRLIQNDQLNVENQLIALLEQELEAPVNSESFLNGLSGMGWFMNHLVQEGFIELDVNTMMADYEKWAFQIARKQFKAGNHDFLHGGLGNLLFLIDRAEESREALAYCAELLADLKASGAIQKDGIYWTEPDFLLEPEYRGQEVINFHLAHGQAGKIMVLAKMLERGIVEAEVPLKAAIDFMMQNENKDQTKAVLPCRIIGTGSENYAHLGWCRGNLGISLALMYAANVIENKEIKEYGTFIAHHALVNVQPYEANLSDTALCHGTAGLAQMYHRLFDLSGVDDFGQASLFWLKKTLENEVDGFKSWNGRAQQWEDNKTLLSGAAGTGLMLIDAISTQKNNWDKALLLS